MMMLLIVPTTNCTKLQLAKPLAGGNDMLAKGTKNVDHLLCKLLQCKRKEAKEKEE